MRKVLILMLMSALLVGAFAMPAAAAPQEALTSLASYFPAETVIYASVRTDDDFIATLETIAEKINSALPAGATIPDLTDALDMAAHQLDPQGDFDSVIRSWLGDTIAVGVPDASSMNSEQSMIVAAQITDAAAADAFIEQTQLLENETYAREELDGYILFSPMTRRAGQPYLILRDDVLLFSLNADLVETGGVLSESLSGSETFQNTLARLPESEYNAVVYNDYGQLINAMMANSMSMGNSMNQMPEGYLDILNAIGPQAYGATVIDGRSLTIDLAASFTDPSAFDAFGGLSLEGLEAVDPAFAHFIPAGTPLVVHANGANFTYEQQMDSFNSAFDSFMAQGMVDEDDLQDVKAAIFAFETGLRGLTGLEPSEVFDWMTGDMAIYAGLSPRASDASSMMDVISELPIDFAITLAATDPAAASAVVEGLANGVENLPVDEISTSREDINGTSALVFTITSNDLPFPIELLLAANDDVFSFGTRRYVSFALNPGEGLDTDPAFIEAAATLAPNPSAVLYFSGAGLQPFANLLTLEGNSSSTQRDAETVSAVLDLFSSASISVGYVGDDFSYLVRMVWTLPE